MNIKIKICINIKNKSPFFIKVSAVMNIMANFNINILNSHSLF